MKNRDKILALPLALFAFSLPALAYDAHKESKDLAGFKQWSDPTALRLTRICSDNQAVPLEASEKFLSEVLLGATKFDAIIKIDGNRIFLEDSWFDEKNQILLGENPSLAAENCSPSQSVTIKFEANPYVKFSEGKRLIKYQDASCAFYSYKKFRYHALRFFNEGRSIDVIDNSTKNVNDCIPSVKGIYDYFNAWTSLGA